MPNQSSLDHAFSLPSSSCHSFLSVQDVRSPHVYVASIRLPSSRFASTYGSNAHRFRSSLMMVVGKCVRFDFTLVFFLSTLWSEGQLPFEPHENCGWFLLYPRGVPLWISTHRPNPHGATRRRRRSASQGTRGNSGPLHARHLDVGRPGRT